MRKIELPLPWTLETMAMINKMTPTITGKAFDPDWFLLRQRFEQYEQSAVNAIAQRDGLAASLRDAVRYIERNTAHNGAMDAKTLEAEEKHIREYVSEVSTGRWAGDLVRFDLAQARKLLAKLSPTQ